MNCWQNEARLLEDAETENVAKRDCPRIRLACCGATPFVSPCFWAALIALLLIVTSCQALPEPPRLATATARAVLPPTPTPEPLLMTVAAPETAAAPADLPDLSGEPNPSLTVWVDENSAVHEKAVGEIAEGFSQAHDVNVEVMFIAPGLLPELVETAAISETYDLPDIVIHPLEYTIGWVERGILNADAAETAVTHLGRETFNQDALDLVAMDGKAAAVPLDGFQQLLIYRSDWFADKNLDVPDNYAAILAGAEAIYDPENLKSGFVIPTESNLTTTHQAFEQIAAANGCQLIDSSGEVLLLEPACLEALQFYYSIVNQFSPVGVQTDTSVLNAYLEGRTGMIMAPPSVLPQLAGLDADNLPTCPECSRNPGHLAENSGIITQIFGNSDLSANFGEIISLGITNDADPETAVAFAEYWLSEGYDEWLAVESERKVPMRHGTAADPGQFIDQWGLTPLEDSGQSLTDLFGGETVAQLREGIAQSNRWGIAQGQGGLMTDLYRELTFSVVLQEMLSGYFNIDETLFEAYSRVLELIPDYAFTPVLEPTPVPDDT